jgi:hypothetical protein
LLRIRLARTGAKKQSSYRVVVIDGERARDGRFVEIVGHYNPRRTPPEIVLKRERVDYWIGRGAQRLPQRPHELRLGVLTCTGSKGSGHDNSSAREGQMKDLIEAIAKALVDNPEQVAVRAVEGEQVTVLELRVDPSDLGKVIGKQGRTARSIRTILNAAGMKLKRRFTLEILE